MSSEAIYMAEAVRLSAEGMQRGEGGPFGCVIVKDGQIIGRGYNRVLSSKDPTAHAEMVAIRDAAQRMGHFHLDGADLYTSCEPCPMCLGAIYWARIGRIFYANTRADAEAIGFGDAMIYREIGLPLPARSIPAIPTGRDMALEIFARWRDKEDKVSY